MDVEKKIPEIRFKGFDGEWKLFSLGELGSVATNKRIFIHETSLIGDVPFYKIGTFGREPKLFISQELFDDYKKRYPFPEKGDLLFSVIGSIGRVVEYTGEDEYFQDSNVVWLKHDGAIVNSFLKQFYSIVEWEGIEGSTIKHLYNRTILGTKIQTPSREEQTQIGNTFQKLDSLINQHQQKHDKLSNIKKAMLEKMFPKQGETTPEIRSKGFHGEWEEKPLKKVASDISDGNWIESEHIFNSGEYRIIQTGNIGIGSYLDRTKHAKFFHQTNFDVVRGNEIYPGDILISRLAEPAGRAVILPDTGYRMVTAVDVAIVRPESTFDSYFIMTFLNKDETLKAVSEWVSGTSHKRISLANLVKIKITLPCVKEQIAIGNYFQKLDTLINQHQQQITKLNNIKQACLKKMFV